MKIRRSALLSSILGASVLAGCGAPPGGEATGDTNSAIVLASDPNWATGLSPDAVRVGTDGDGTPLYSCRAQIGNSITTGKTRHDWGVCDVSYGGVENSVANYQTLVPEWDSGTYGSIPTNAIPVGYENGMPIYACRAVIQGGSLQVGKIRSGFAGCSYPYGGVEMNAVAYQVLSSAGRFAVNPIGVAAGTKVMPFDAILTGTDNGGGPLYSCTVAYQGTTQVGKVAPGWGACDISWGGREISVANTPYSVLSANFVAPPLNGATLPFIGGTDANNAPLGICNVSYAGGIQVGKYVSSGACMFGYGGREISLTSGYQVFADVASSAPITFDFASITFPSGVALGGFAQVTMNVDGSYVFSGHFHDSGTLAYNENTIVVAKAADGTAFTFSRSGSSYGTFEPGSRDDDWSISGNNPTIAAKWGYLKQPGVVAQQTSSVSLNFTEMWSALETDIGYVEDVVTVCGAVL
jgi:hypothetical protein